MIKIKKIIQKLARKSGYDIHKIIPDDVREDAFYMQKSLLKNVEMPIIFDVGAHYGETCLEYNKLFDKCIIHSFEPFKESFDILSENIKPFENIKAYNVALGDKTGKINFHINPFSATNSILPTHKEGPITWGGGLLETLSLKETSIETIDNFIQNENISKIDLLKLDTQGSEFMVLAGAEKTINKIRLVYIEIITMPTYEGQKELDEILNYFRVHNFILFNFYNQTGYSLTNNGRLRNVDAIFLNKNFL